MIFISQRKLLTIQHRSDLVIDFYNYYKQQAGEGWVFEDANGFMVKYKTRFYKFWKQMRAVKERLQQGNNVKKIFTTENEVRVFNILKSIEPDKLKELSIIDIL